MRERGRGLGGTVGVMVVNTDRARARLMLKARRRHQQQQQQQRQKRPGDGNVAPGVDAGTGSEARELQQMRASGSDAAPGRRSRSELGNSRKRNGKNDGMIGKMVDEGGSGGGSGSDDDDLDERDHEAQLQQLHEADPEFYEFLKENDKELLDFHLSSSDGELDGTQGDGDSDSDGPQEGKAARKQSRLADAKAKSEQLPVPLLTMADLQKLEMEISSGRTRPDVFNKACKRMLHVFRAGVDIAERGVSVAGGGKRKSKTKTKTKAKKRGRRQDDGSESDDQDAGTSTDDGSEEEENSAEEDMELGLQGGRAGARGSVLIRFASEKVYRRAVTFSWFKMLDCFETALLTRRGASAQKAGPAVDPTENVQWNKFEPVIKFFGLDLVRFLEVVSDARLTRRILQSYARLTPFFKAIPKLAFRCIRSACRVWATLAVSDATAMRAFLFLLSAAAAHDALYAERVAKSMFRSFVASRELGRAAASSRNIARLLFSCKCITQVFGVDLEVSYALVFTYVRELAVQIKSAISSASLATKNSTEKTKNNRTEDKMQRMFSWNVVNILRVIGSILCEFPLQNQLRPLIYPYVQVSLELVRAASGPRNVGVQFHVIGFLVDLEANTGVYIPLSASCVALLDRNASLRKRALSAADQQQRTSKKRKQGMSALRDTYDWRFVLRASADDQQSAVFARSVVHRFAYLLGAHLNTMARSPAFPELAHPALRALRPLAKDCKHAELKEFVRDLIRAVEEQSELVTRARAALKQGPNSIFGALTNAAPPQQSASQKENLRVFLSNAEFAVVSKAKKLPMECWYEAEMRATAQRSAILDASVKTDADLVGRLGGAHSSYAEEDDVHDDDTAAEADTDALMRAAPRASRKDVGDLHAKGPAGAIAAVPSMDSEDESDHVAQLELSDQAESSSESEALASSSSDDEEN